MDTSPEVLHDSPNGLLRCRCTVEDGCTVLYVSGEIDIATRDAFASAVALHCNGPLTVDLAEVHFMGAAGVHVLRRAQRFLHRVGHTLTIRSASPCVERIMELCGVNSEPTVPDPGLPNHADGMLLRGMVRR